MKNCDHKFIDSNYCIKCNNHKDTIKLYSILAYIIIWQSTINKTLNGCLPTKAWRKQLKKTTDEMSAILKLYMPTGVN